jgi:YidB-like protein
LESAVSDIGKLSKLLDDPEVRELMFGLTHVGSAPPSIEPGPARLHAVVLHLAETTDPEQYRSWLADGMVNRPMTVDQVRMTIGDTAIDDLARLTQGSAGAVTWQLASVLPDVVDAVSPGGEVIDAVQLACEIDQAIAYDDRSAGAFGARLP